ncbi:putative inactive receptor kinase [Dendrobium catenatum]|uniref:Putative inactive receptor kinase n=1 Tax=Dendrobium catenatum TaxID=906689 RepID=A0A2I0WQA4_9ASPA|nr:putative inactive receptor kinase [Dendrobium catenatum]
MLKLIRLNLARNGFTGQISPAFGNLSCLRTLYLEIDSFGTEVRSSSFFRFTHNLRHLIKTARACSGRSWRKRKLRMIFFSFFR